MERDVTEEEKGEEGRALAAEFSLPVQHRPTTPRHQLTFLEHSISLRIFPRNATELLWRAVAIVPHGDLPGPTKVSAPSWMTGRSPHALHLEVTLPAHGPQSTRRSPSSSPGRIEVMESPPSDPSGGAPLPLARGPPHGPSNVSARVHTTHARRRGEERREVGRSQWQLRRPGPVRVARRVILAQHSNQRPLRPGSRSAVWAAGFKDVSRLRRSLLEVQLEKCL